MISEDEYLDALDTIKMYKTQKYNKGKNLPQYVSLDGKCAMKYDPHNDEYYRHAGCWSTKC
jgi:hypothetical protein